MLKSSNEDYTQKKETHSSVENFMYYHQNMGLFLCGMVMPIIVLLAVTVLCYAVMLPISLFMGWL